VKTCIETELKNNRVSSSSTHTLTFRTLASFSAVLYAFSTHLCARL
jgi:hypothetical protein